MPTVITMGTFDLFHIGHLHVLQRARAMGDNLVVGVSSDELNMKKKNRVPLIKLSDRLAIVNALECVNEVFVEESLESKEDYLRQFGSGPDTIFVIGDDWKGKFDYLPFKVVYLERTPEISTTDLIKKIQD